MEKQMTKDEFKAYVGEQVEKILGEADPTKTTERIDALRKAFETAKQAFGASSAVTIQLFVDDWQQKDEPPKEIDPSKVQSTTTGGPVAKADASEALPWPGDMSSPAFLEGKPEPVGQWGRDPDAI